LCGALEQAGNHVAPADAESLLGQAVSEFRRVSDALGTLRAELHAQLATAERAH
jgi:hypothetical protein